jgi:hypothetical protein
MSNRYGRYRQRYPVYREYFYIYQCKVCRIEFRPQHEDRYRRYLRLCHKCRMEYSRKRYRAYYLSYFQALPPERQRTIKAKRYAIWKVWVGKNIERRRKQALESYHRCKHRHNRRHRRTRIPQI